MRFLPGTAKSSRRKFKMFRDRTDSYHPLLQVASRFRTSLVWLAFTFSTTQALAQTSLEAQFKQNIQPFLQRYCNECHSGEAPEAKLDTTVFLSLTSVSNTWGTWQEIVSRVHETEMPPADASPQPTEAERAMLKQWTQEFRKSEAERMRDDPGPVSTRRLNNAEFNYTIRDLTGVDIQPTKSFPIDPANEAGFDNSAESLAISPALVTKYIDAARLVADHMLLTPEGIRFAPHPVVTDTDRDKYSVQRIVDFYLRQPIRYEDYLLACRQVQIDSQKQSVAEAIKLVAKRYKVSEKYLRTVWDTLNDQRYSYGPLRTLRTRWHGLSFDPSKFDEAQTICKELASFIKETREPMRPRFANLQGPAGLSGGSQTLVLWKNRQMASHRRKCNVDALADTKYPLLDKADLEAYRSGSELERAQITAAYQQFCSVFPDAFYISERGRAHIDAKDAAEEGKGRLLSAGFHSMMGYFRDDQPLYEMILSAEQQHELDQLWRELDFLALAPIRQYSGFIWYERAESTFINEDKFNFVRAEDRSANTEEMIKRFAAVYLDKVRNKNGDPQVVEAVETYFATINRQLRQLETELQAAQPTQRAALVDFAERAYRRPLTTEERQSIEDFYVSSRRHPSADHRSAMEDTLISILVSPSQLYRWDLQSRSTALHPLVGYEMASRLSYFLWASLPDDKLRNQASLNQLNDPQLLIAEMQRMLKDERARGMAREFMGNWLDFRRFDNHNGVDRDEFPSFDDRLRQSMADEPIEYFLDLLRRNGSIMELLESDHMIVDEVLAKHYGIDDFSASPAAPWQRIDNAGKLQRGGLLPMAVFLTQNSPGQRTSPVKRGYWVVRKLLGEKIPPPPPNVPELPASEHQLGDLTLRDLLSKHREHPSCASCHDRFDAAGLLLEGFDPLGRPRTKDLGGRTVATDAVLPNGKEANGLNGLQEYIRQQRAEDFRRHFCQSLVSYALGRSLIIPDDLLINEMLDQLQKNGNRIQIAFETIVRSPQFRNKRGSAASQTEAVHAQSR
jgi:Protein of unknown function (DUF1592)/Protein of unknown function (DUF1588)/Protein of unknown function (DUF1587)/Protein of unknown function (DUF1585)/Protein of unknown function (DUF1595)